MDSYNNIEAYLQNRLSGTERVEFEAEMEMDTSLKEAVIFQKAVIHGLRVRAGEKALKKVKKFKAMLDDEDNDLIESYLSGELSASEIQKIENRISKDKTFADKVNVTKGLVLGLKLKRDEDSLGKIRQFKKLLDEEKSPVSEPKIEPAEQTASHAIVRKLMHPRNLMIAASLLFLLVVGGLFFMDNNLENDKLFLAYASIDDIEEDMRGQLNNDLRNSGGSWDEESPQDWRETIKGITSILDGNYKAAIFAFSTLETQKAPYYKAIAYWENKDYNSAKVEFKQVIQNNQFKTKETLVFQYAKWYLALIHLKDGDVSSAKVMLNEISADRENEILAVHADKLLKEL